MSDPNTDVKSVLLQEANTKHKLTMQLADVTFDPPALLDATVLDFSHPTKRNSRTVIRAGADGGPKVAVTIDYNRLGLTKAFNMRSPVFPDDGQTSAHGLLAALSARLGTPVTADDLVDHPIDRNASPPSILLEAKPLSMKFLGTMTVTLDADDTPQPVLANRMLFSNTSASRLTDDLVVYVPVTDQFAPVIVENRPARTAGLAEGFMVCLQTPEYGKIQINFRPGENMPWQKVTIDGELESPNAVVFMNEAYFAASDFDKDPVGLCGLNRIKFDLLDGVWSVRFERVMDLWTDNVNVPIQMAVDTIQNIMIVSSGHVHYTLDGREWDRVELPMLRTGPGTAPLPRVMGLGLYDNKLRAVACNIPGGNGSSAENWEYIFCDAFIPGLGQERTFTVEPYTFGPHGDNWMSLNYSQGQTFYYGPEGWFFGLGVFTPRRKDGNSMDEDAVIGQIFKFQEDTRTWKIVSRDTGIVEAAFVKLDAALVYAGGNNNNLGGMENVVVSYDEGETWVADPADADSPFKLEPRSPATLTPIHLNTYTGVGPYELEPLPDIVEKTWPASNPVRFDSQAVEMVDNGETYYVISGSGGLRRVDSSGEIDPNWGGSFYQGYSMRLFFQLDGKLIILGTVNQFNGQPTGYTNLIRLNRDCTIDTTFVEPMPNNQMPILDMVHLEGGGWVLVGQFWQLGTAGNKPYIARFEEDWTQVPNWGPVTFQSYRTRAAGSVKQLPDGTVLISASNYGPDRTTASCWNFCDPVSGAPVANYWLNLGTGQLSPDSGNSPNITALMKEPGGNDYWWIFTNYRDFPQNSWGIRFDPVAQEVVNYITEGEVRGPGALSWVMRYGKWHLVNSAPYTGATWQQTVYYEFSRVEFYDLEGSLLPPRERVFGVYAQDVRNTTSMRLLPLNGNGKYLMYGEFNYINQAGYPLNNRVASKSMAIVQIETGQT